MVGRRQIELRCRRTQRYSTRPESLQLGVLRFGLLQDGDVRVGVLPQREEIVIGGFCFGNVTLHGVGTCEAEMGESAQRKIQNNAAMVENLLKLFRGLRSLVRRQIGLSSHVDGIQSPKLKGWREPQFVVARGLQE